MPSDALYTFTVYDSDWDIVTYVTDYVSASGRVGINEGGYLSLEVAEDSHAAAIMAEGSRVVMERVPPFGDTSHKFFEGELDTIRESHSGQRKTVTMECSGALAILQRVINAYPANTAPPTTFSSQRVDLILFWIMSYNLGASTGDRVRTPDITDVSVTVSDITGVAPTIDYNAAWRNIYDVVTEVLDAYSYEIQAEAFPTFNQWQLTVTEPVGDDKTGSVLLSRENGIIPQYDFVRTTRDIKTVAIVGGSGQESARTTAVRTGSTYNATSRSNEVFVDARQTGNSTHLNAIGDAKLRQAERTRYYEHVISQNEIHRFADISGSNYYYIGDTVSVLIDGTTYNRRVTAADFSLSAGKPEQLRLTFEDD